MKKLNDRLKSALIGIALAVPVSLYAISQAEINAEAHRNDFKPVAEVRLVEIPVVECVEEPLEEQPKEENTYFDVPLSEELQKHIFAECEECNIAPALVVAIIERESNYDAGAVGDSGSSLGLMQIQQKWHGERMDNLGCTDLLDAFQNVTVGIDYLAELKDRNGDLYWVLMAYNGGATYANRMVEAGTYSAYAVEVAERAAELEGGEQSWN